MTQESYPASALHAYPGGPAAWIAAMSAKANREASVCAKNAHTDFCVKSVTRGAMGSRDEQSTTDGQKNAAGGSIGRNSHTTGVPNQTEQRYRDEFLIPRILSGEIAECVFEGRTFELAHRCTYTPDWWCRLADGREECHEVKGAHVWDDARVKAKVAARMNATICFYWCQWKGGKWRIKQIPA